MTKKGNIQEYSEIGDEDEDELRTRTSQGRVKDEARTRMRRG